MSEKLTETSKPIRWWFSSAVEGWSMIALGAATLVLFVISKPPSPSPLIGSYLDLLPDRSRWAAEYVYENQGASFWLSLAFIVVLTIFLAGVYVYARGSRLGNYRGRTVRYFHRPDHWDGQRLQALSAAVIFPAMLFSNVALFVYYREVLLDSAWKAQGAFYIIYTVALISRIAGLVFGVGTLVQYALADFGSDILGFLRRYLRYFYPTLLSLLIVGVVFQQMDQFDSLFIALVRDPVNFALFALLLFPASLVVVWFAPYYLFFTDYSYAHREKSWAVLHQTIRHPNRRLSRWRIFHWLGLHKRLIVGDEDKDRHIPPVPVGFMPNRTEAVEPMTIGFHRLRIFLGIAYIFTLCSICLSIYFDNQREPGRQTTIASLLLFAAAVGYWIYTERSLNLARQDPAAAARPPLGRRGVEAWGYWWEAWFYLLDNPSDNPKRRFHYVANQIPFWIGVVAVIGFGISLAVILSWDHRGADWQSSFRWFNYFLGFSIIYFPWLAVYRRFYRNFTFSERRLKTYEGGNTERTSRWDLVMDRIDHLSVQVMLLLNPTLAALALVFFLLGLLWPGFLPSGVGWLNPLNIYLLMVNGAIAGVLLLDRYLLLREHVNQFKFFTTGDGERDTERYFKPASHVFFWGAAIVMALLAVSYLGNGYHEVTYRAEAVRASRSTAGQEPWSLRKYTAAFLERYDSTKPIILVASDGGGLKACYWTMLNLQRLDELGLMDNVFMMSGASGGNVGLAMYTYLKAQDYGPAGADSLLEKIGASNFLSNDLAGVLTRFPINYVPDVPGYPPSRWEDRSEAMARAYFDILSDADHPVFGYEAVRAAPYWDIWQRRAYRLPLFVANTTRAEDGMQGVVHPLAPDPELTSGFVDLQRNAEGRAISFPDAVFLANRFPIMSPVGRIPGRGHFIDAGAADNSGVSTIYHFLRYMKASATSGDTLNARVFRTFFTAPAGRALLGLRNDKLRFIRDEFYDQLDAVNRNVYRSEIQANTTAALNTGLSGVPNFWDDFLRSATPQQLGLLDTFVVLNLPFRLRDHDVHDAFSGELNYDRLADDQRAINAQIERTLGCDRDDDCYIVAPPLGRLLAQPSRAYMRAMVDWPENLAVFNALNGPRDSAIQSGK